MDFSPQIDADGAAAVQMLHLNSGKQLFHNVTSYMLCLFKSGKIEIYELIGVGDNTINCNNDYVDEQNM